MQMIRKSAVMCACMISILLLMLVSYTAVSHAAEAEKENLGLAVIGNDVNGNAGFHNNMIILTEEQREELKTNRNPEVFGLGDCWESDKRFSSYDNHGIGGYHYTIADGINIYKMLQNVVSDNAINLKKVSVYASDGYYTISELKDFPRMMYYGPGDSTGVASPYPMIAFYKTTNYTQETEGGTEPEGPAEKLPSGDETYIFGQKEGPNESNNCHYLKYANAVVTDGFICYIRSKTDKSAAFVKPLKDILNCGIYKDTYEIDGQQHNVKGLPFTEFEKTFNISKYMPDYADVKLCAESSDGEKIIVTREEMNSGFIAWDYSDEMAVPEKQTGNLAYYVKGSDGEDKVLYNLSYFYVVDKDENIVTSVPEEPAEPPVAVKNLKAARASYSSIKLSWTKAADADGYQIVRATSKTGKYAAVKTVTGGTFLNTGLKTGNTYYYKVRAFKNDGGDKLYGAYSQVASAKTTLEAPTAKVSAARKSITVKWNKVAGATGYKIYRASKKTGSYKCIKTIKGAGTLYFKNKNLKTGKKYYYKVRAYRTSGGKTAFSSYSQAVYAKVK